MHSVWLALVLLPVLGGAERFNCRTRILGAYYADAKSGCKAFHVCVRVAGGGVRDFRFFCPPGTLFHQEAQTCTDWGDDDPLACPAEIYDGQFDLYKIGSGFDTKKLSSSGNRDDESEFGLQRAETGDRRSSQNNAASDLRAAHSSDFFSGQRDRGRDEAAPAPAPRPQQYQPQPQSIKQAHHNHKQQHQQPQHQQNQQQSQYQQPSSQQPASHAPRQSFRRPTTPRAPPTTTEYINTPPPSPPQPASPAQYDSKRKLVRKRPIYVSQSTPAPQTTFAQSTQLPQSFPEQSLQQQQNFNRRAPQARPTIPPVNVPPQFKDYKDEYVEVSRVTPKPNKYFQAKSPAPFSQSTPAPHVNKNNKDGLVELYNYDTQSTPGLGSQNENRPFKVRNSFSVTDPPREPDFARTNSFNTNRGSPTTVDYSPLSRGTASTPAFKNYNSVSYEPEKNNFVPYSKQQNYFSNPTTPPTTTIYTTTYYPDTIQNLNTVAYNTNIGFGNAQQSNNYAESDEDDGQYRPPQGEDDGQYRPELYERELLSGAHSLNIAASGNRLPEDQKPRGKTQAPFKTPSQNTQTPFKTASQTPYKPVSQTAAPRPFKPAPTPSSATQRTPETYPTTSRPQTQPQTQRTFDYFQTYTTTSRPNEASTASAAFNLDFNNQYSPRPTTTPRNPEPRQPNRAALSPPQKAAPPSPPQKAAPPAPPAPPRPTTRPPPYASPVSNKEDNSYDYAYYDSDTGFSEYDHIEEFGKTKTKKA